jgi:RibD C-terminal domain
MLAAARSSLLTYNRVVVGSAETERADALFHNDLARRGLVDEVRLWLHPVVWGDGVRALHAGELPIRMRLIGARTFPSDVVLLSYQPLEP